MILRSPLSTDAHDRPWSWSTFEIPGRSPDTAIWDAIEAASADIGSENFYDRLLEVLGALVEADLLSLVRYSSFGAPDLIIPREIRDELAVPYNAGLYAYDPFHHYWQTVAKPAVKSLRHLAPAELWKGSYGLEFLQPACISDEIAVFLPPIGGASPTLVLDRESGWFNTVELARVERMFPLLAGLHNAHLKVIVSRGMIADTAEKPLRLIDRSGKELATNLAWRKLAAEPESGLSDAVAAVGSPGATQVSLPDGRRLIRSPLASDFGAAPGGLCDQVEAPDLTDASASLNCWLAPLTQREKQIVMLTLEGHPIAGIAKRLGVTPGTIKNHRLRLYQKLDITTERELFLTHMRHLRVVGG